MPFSERTVTPVTGLADVSITLNASSSTFARDDEGFLVPVARSTIVCTPGSRSVLE